jgi:hypothetical protein
MEEPDLGVTLGFSGLVFEMCNWHNWLRMMNSS